MGSKIRSTALALLVGFAGYWVMRMLIRMIGSALWKAFWPHFHVHSGGPLWYNLILAVTALVMLFATGYLVGRVSSRHRVRYALISGFGIALGELCWRVNMLSVSRHYAQVYTLRSATTPSLHQITVQFLPLALDPGHYELRRVVCTEFS